MTVAGLDLGTTLAKAVWGDPLSHRTVQLDELGVLLGELRSAGVTRLAVCGTSHARLASELSGFEVETITGDDVDAEVLVQARGVRALLEGSGPSPERLLVVSVGTGVSYTFVGPDGCTRFPLGSAIGGGFLHGLSQLLGAESFEAFAAEAATGKPLDLLVEDQLPATLGTPIGRLVLAHFGKAEPSSARADAFASLLTTVATTIARDLAVMGMSEGFALPGHVVLIGSPLGLAPLRDRLEAYARSLGQEPLVPERGAYALALGAMLSVH